MVMIHKCFTMIESANNPDEYRPNNDIFSRKSWIDKND